MTAEDVATLAAGTRLEARFSFGLNVLTCRGTVYIRTEHLISVRWDDDVRDALDLRSPLWRLIKVVK